MNRSLIQAAWNGDVDELLKEIDKNPSMLHVVAMEGSETPLHIACFAGHVNFASTLIKLKQEFSRELNQDGFTPLHIAAACGHTEIVKELLKVDIGLCLIKGKDRKIPLHFAVVKGKVEVVKELLLASSDSVDFTTARLETPLHLAVKNNKFEAFKVLIQHLKKVNKEDLLNSKDIQGNTILHLGVSMKQYEVVDFLLNEQATIKGKIELNSLNKRGLTPLDMLLMFQSEAGDREIEDILIKSGGLKSENLQSPTYTHIERSNHTDTRHENPRSNLSDYFKYNNLKDSPNMVRNTLLVIVILITTATYQPALSPPGGAWQDDSIPSTNHTISTKSHIAGKAIMGTKNPIAYSIFLFANSVGFYTSVHMIYVLTAAFPLQLELRISMFAISVTYATCMNEIAPTNYITFGFIGISIALPFAIPCIIMLLRNYLKKGRNVLPETSQERV
ncbi:ankyrin repeat-containing protein BDA1 [Lactuca sativa]|uniref:PGG domain-containing protein n=1 Tax=Lactuca sativa TaxID=4236 RepID=A0A9R1WQS9_LACSA|nr:ankyrin repeat-containing protein BDA1 [Lactuca sativa]KAJ0227988.1 hypothetical protein LSAT_V11C100033430 [Lactuca sativa]